MYHKQILIIYLKSKFFSIESGGTLRLGFPKDKILTSKSTFISDSPAAVGSGTTYSQKFMPEMKMLCLQEKGA
jgi:hypothetical protein